MAKSGISQITTAQTFQTWLDRTNQLVDLMGSDVMTASALGDTTNGNSTLVGSFTANTVIAFNTLRSDTISPKVGSTEVSITAPISVTSTSQNTQTLISDSGPRVRYSSGSVIWRTGFLSVGAEADDNFFTIDTGTGTPKLTLSPSGDLAVAGTISANGGFTGNVTGNLTGNVTGNVTGDLLGNLEIEEDGTLDASNASSVLFPAGLGLIPIGGIIMWSGSVASIPTGWALCDGNNGTPNLTGKFVVGYDAADADYNTIGKVGGAKTVTLAENQIPAHSHAFSASGNTNTDGAHKHRLQFAPLGNSGNSNYFGGEVNRAQVFANASGGRFANEAVETTNSAHSHAFSVSGTTSAYGDGDAHENRPPYYTVAYIMKVSSGSGEVGGEGGGESGGGVVSSLSSFTTSDLSEGLNLYFTNDRADARARVVINSLRVGEVGTYIFAMWQPQSVFGNKLITLGMTVPGNELLPAAPGGDSGSVSFTDNAIRWDGAADTLVADYGQWPLNGTWQACGKGTATERPSFPVTLWLRIA